MAGRQTIFLLFLLFGVVVVASAQIVPPAGRAVLGRPGYLVMASARDSLAGYTWRPGSEPRTRSLVWPHGVLTIPDDFVPEDFLEADLGFPLTADFGGTGASGNLSLEDGNYKISEPVMLSDGVLRLYVSRGELKIRGDRVRYLAPDVKKVDLRANFLLLAGIMLLILVLMRRARRILKRSR